MANLNKPLKLLNNYVLHNKLNEHFYRFTGAIYKKDSGKVKHKHIHNLQYITAIKHITKFCRYKVNAVHTSKYETYCPYLVT